MISFPPARARAMTPYTGGDLERFLCGLAPAHCASARHSARRPQIAENRKVSYGALSFPEECRRGPARPLARMARATNAACGPLDVLSEEDRENLVSSQPPCAPRSALWSGVTHLVKAIDAHVGGQALAARSGGVPRPTA
jgi:hypothetical protein